MHRCGYESTGAGGCACTRASRASRPRLARGTARRRLLVVEPIGELARVVGRLRRGSPRRTARGRRRAGRRAIRSCCAHAIPIGGRPSASVRALHTGVTTSWRSVATSAVGSRRGAGSRTDSSTSDRPRRSLPSSSASGSRQTSSTVSAPTSASRSAVACSTYSRSASSRSSASARSRSHGTRSSSLAATVAARGPTTAADIGLQRAEVAPAVEDHRHRLADGQSADPERHGNGRRVVEQRPAE